MDRTIKKNAENYTQLVTALIDRCFASDKADLRYNSILDAADLVSLERYKIDGDYVLYGNRKPQRGGKASRQPPQSHRLNKQLSRARK